jgi:hypothetical protein
MIERLLLPLRPATPQQFINPMRSRAFQTLMIFERGNGQPSSSRRHDNNK